MFDVALSAGLAAKVGLVLLAATWLATMVRYSNVERRRLRREAILATDPWARVSEQFRNFAATIGELTPVVQNAATAMTALGRAFAALDDALPDADRSGR